MCVCACVVAPYMRKVVVVVTGGSLAKSSRSRAAQTGGAITINSVAVAWSWSLASNSAARLFVPLVNWVKAKLYTQLCAQH